MHEHATNYMFLCGRSENYRHYICCVVPNLKLQQIMFFVSDSNMYKLTLFFVPSWKIAQITVFVMPDWQNKQQHTKAEASMHTSTQNPLKLRHKQM